MQPLYCVCNLVSEMNLVAIINATKVISLFVTYSGHTLAAVPNGVVH